VSLSAEQMTLIMALADDELDGDERAQAEELVATSADARKVYEAMSGPVVGAVGEWVATSQIDRAVAASADSITASVMAAIANEPPKVSSLDAARARRDARLKAAALVVAAASMAAGVFFFFGTDKVTPPPGPAPVASNTAAPPVTVPMPSPSALATADPAPSAPDEPSAGPEVTVESTTSHDVSVFHVPASIGAAVNTPGSVIVWIGDDKPEGK
jgi:hypothetical protein